MDWSEREFMKSKFGDKRLTKRCIKLASELGSHPNESIPVSSKGFAETIGAYRFFDNEKVTSDKILSSHKEATLERIQQEEVVLLLQDTTELDYTSKQSKMKGLGVLNIENRKGVYAHPVYAVSEDRIPLGVVSCEFTKRQEIKTDKRSWFKLPIEEKESYRWVLGFEIGCQIAEEARDTQIIVIGDRESDIYEIFVEAGKPQGCDFIVRGNHDRRLREEEEGKRKYIKESLESSKPKGILSFKLRDREGRSSRDVELVIYAQTLEPKAPQRKGSKLPNVEINCILAKEDNPPDGEEGIEWYLITSLPIRTVSEVERVMRYYLCRWEIEVFFRTLKTGCKIEELQLEDISRLEPCVALYMVIAWHVMYLTMLGRTCPDLPCDTVFEDYEWRTAWAVANKEKAPETPPSLQEMIIIIAKFGGYLNRKNDFPPGAKAMWIGLQKLRNYVEGFRACEEIYRKEQAQAP